MAATPTVPRPIPPRAAAARPDPSGLRVAIGFAGFAASTALVSAFLAPAPTVVVTAAAPAPSVQHVIRYVNLQPGQTAPPNANVVAAPVATPRLVVVTTRQSGLP